MGHQYLGARFERWDALRAVDEKERERVAYLNGPVPRNPPELLAPTRCRVLRPIFVRGARVEVGSEIELPLHDARSLAAIGRVAII